MPFVDTLRLYTQSIVIALISVVLFYYLHWNFSSKSVWDNAFEGVCRDSQHIIACSLIYGAIENTVFFIGLFVCYQLICHYFWKWRYESDITNIISEMAKCENPQRKSSDYKAQPIEETTKKMGYSYNLDPFILFCPYLISPILKWSSMTNLLIHLSYYITYRNLPFPDDDSKEQSGPWRIHYSEIEIIQLNWPKIINPFPEGYAYETDITLHYSIFRSVWTFLIWTCIDFVLWRGDYGLVYLFETGINNVMQRYTKLHCQMINDLLLQHVEHIGDLARLIVSFHGDGPLEQFVLIKVKLHECLKQFQLELLFNILTAFTVIASSLRIYYIPVMVNLMNPICYVLGITAFIVLVAILVFNGVGSDAMHLLREFEELFNYCTQIGAIVLSVLWSMIVWRNMQQKKEDLIEQQNKSLIKEFMDRVFEYKRENVN